MIQLQDELQAWLALADGSMAARQRSRQLLQHFGGPLEVFQAGRSQAEAALGGEACSRLFSALPRWAETAERTRRWLAQDSRHHLITLGDAAYPAGLLNSPDPPLVLHAMGCLSALAQPAVAIVGSRHATPAGTEVAQRLASELGQAGVAVVSGLAVGIDAAAHRGCLRGSPPGTTVAVVACGLQEVYPRIHEALFEQIKREGLIISEHPLGIPALPPYFPQRNRIIAGISLITVVVEATLRSGSLITARLALEAGREVFAVPGPLSAPQSAGCNALIKAGAGLVECSDDLIDALPWGCLPSGARAGERRAGPHPQGTRTSHTPRHSRHHRRDSLGRANAAHTRTLPGIEPGAPRPNQPSGALSPPPGISPQAWGRACALLRSRPCDLLELSGEASVNPHLLNQALLMAELDGLVGRLPGGLYQWCSSCP